MNISLDLIKRIISSDDLCDKVNSSEHKEAYKNQIREFVLTLINDFEFNKNYDNLVFINRYIRKFVLNSNLSKEDKFYDIVFLKMYKLNIKNKEFNNILIQLNFNEIKQILIKKYEEIINNNTKINNDYFIKIYSFYCYIASNIILPTNYIDYFTYNIINKNIRLDFDMCVYFYKSFALSYSFSKKLNVSFVLENGIKNDDPYYESEKNRIIIYKQSIGSSIDYNVIADIFYQIKVLYLINNINNNNEYTYEQLKFVKELSLISILGKEYYEDNYKKISFTKILKDESYEVLNNYFSKIGLSVNYDLINYVDSVIDTSNVCEDIVTSIDILFDEIIKRENVNLIKELIRNYPILGCEYKNGKKKTLLGLLLDIYNNKKLLNDLNRDLSWYNKKEKDDIVISKIEKLENKIKICTSCIQVMNMIINNSDMISEDILKSISSLIFYNTNDELIKKDIILLLSVVIPKKISDFCLNKNEVIIEDLKKKVIFTYIEGINKKKDEYDLNYFISIYRSLDKIVNSFK